MSCQHRGCRCEEASVERGGRKFCSETCAENEATGRPASSCDCGHADCAA